MSKNSEPQDELANAQGRPYYPVGGKLLARILYGSERFDWKADAIPCHDCGAVKGQIHIAGCDVEECPNCHEQALSCDCDLGDSCSATEYQSPN